MKDFWTAESFLKFFYFWKNRKKIKKNGRPEKFRVDGDDVFFRKL